MGIILLSFIFSLVLAQSPAPDGGNCTINGFKGICINLEDESCTFGAEDDTQCGDGHGCCVQEFGSCVVNGRTGTCMDFRLCGNGTASEGTSCGEGDMACCVPSLVEKEKRDSQGSINQRGIDLVKSFEGWMACWYKDAAGYPTIGYWHLIKSGDPYKQGSCITTAQGEALLKSDLRSAENCVTNAVKVSLSGNQFSALVSFTFNLGCGNFQSSTLLQRVNARAFNKVCEELVRWNKAGGKVLPGLTRRRQAECDLFNS